MYKEILNKDQQALFGKLELFSKDFFLVGGTSIALQIGHRESIDFDLFTDKPFKNSGIRKKILTNGFGSIEKVFRDELDQYTILLNNVKLTFLKFPFSLKRPVIFDNGLKSPDLLSLGAMKLYALGRRAKWKDYVDLYFITRDFFSIEAIFKKCHQVFGQEFNEKLSRESMSYFKDIDFSEKVVFKKGFSVKEEAVKSHLVDLSLK